MKVVIVVNAYIRSVSHISQAERIAFELRKAGADCEIVKNINLAKIIKGKAENKQFDKCVFLDKDKASARLLEKSGKNVINSAYSVEVCDDKMLTHIALCDCGINMPDTYYAPLCLYADAEIGDGFIGEVGAGLGFPLVAKMCYGSLGAGVYLIKDSDGLKRFEEKHKLQPHFFQKFVGKGGEDIRVIVIGGKYVCAMKRTNPDDFRSNIGLGGHGENFEADNALINLCERVAKILKLDYCGIDILTDDEGNRYVCEVNSNAFFAEAEKVCKVNIAKKFADMVIAK